MATTLGDLIEFTRHSLSGFDQSREAVTSLSASLTSSGTTLTVTEPEDAQHGLVEIGMELMRAKSVDEQNNQVMLYPFGRGYRGTTATTHDVGDEVRFNPAWPAWTIAKEINGVLTEMYPLIYAVASYDTTVPSTYGRVAVPSGSVGVVSVWEQDAFDNWHRINAWNYDQHAAESTTDKLAIGGKHAPGDAIRVVYAKRPALFDLDGALSQDFATVTGLDERLADLVRLGVAARMAPFIDVARLPFLPASAREDGQGRPADGGAAATRLLLALFKQRLNDEAQVLAKEHPLRAHISGVR